MINCYPVISRLIALSVIPLLFYSLSMKAQVKISDYQYNLGLADYNNQPYILLRSFSLNGILTYLVVNPQNLDTRTIKATELSNTTFCSFEQLCLKMEDTPYIKALLRARSKALPMQDAGITHAFPSEKGITLTIDLCPSHKGLDKDIFTLLTGAFKNIERPIPVALSLTGKFLLTHEDDIQWLKGLVSSGQITITWINHTYHHHYNPATPISHNFLLEQGTDLQSELLLLESAMLEQGLIPSVFFRFPGLVSSQQLVNKVTSYGLITIGSDAWLAKGQKAQPGSLVLIHGNGNEPIGVQDFIKLLASETAAVHQKQWLLYDLRTSAARQ